MPRPKVLQGLRPSHPQPSTPSSPVVVDKSPDPLYKSMLQPLFFLDGSRALDGRDPQIVCFGPRIRLRQPNGKEVWQAVSPDTYCRAVVGQPFIG